MTSTRSTMERETRRVIHLLFKPRTFCTDSESHAAAGACHRLPSVRGRYPLAKSQDLQELLGRQLDGARRTIRYLPQHCLRCAWKIRCRNLAADPRTSVSVGSGTDGHLVQLIYRCRDGICLVAH